MHRTFPVVFFSVILLAIDLYSFQAVRTVTDSLSLSVKRMIFISFWSLTIISLGIVISAALTDPMEWNQSLRIYLFAFVLVTYVSKFFILIFLLMDDVIRLFRWFGTFFTGGVTTETGVKTRSISRLKFISQAGMIASGFLFFNLIYGMARTAFTHQVRRVKIKLPNLPAAFNGLKIVQLSDIHAGTFTRKEPLHEITQTVNNENADLVFITGDLVNNLASEVLPFVDVFEKIKAKLGVYSSLGNHDYGDYQQWNSLEEKTENLNQLANIQREMGWKLLRNENVLLGEEGQQLAIIGVENWSALRNFTRYGDLAKAYSGTENASVKLLLSHDPTHWDAQVTKDFKDVDVTFAGHTHGFQFGIEIPGFRWSPVQYVYRQWAGLYQRANQYLYVNRGIGFLLYPGRVGIPPEITVFELVNA